MTQAERVKQVYAVSLIVGVGWAGLLWLTPHLLAAGYYLSATALYQGFALVCHQQPERSFHWHGFPLAVCARCTGVYVGIAVGLLLYPFVRDLREREFPARHWLVVAALPMLLDVVGQAGGIGPGGQATRPEVVAVQGAGNHTCLAGALQVGLQPFGQPGAARPDAHQGAAGLQQRAHAGQQVGVQRFGIELQRLGHGSSRRNWSRMMAADAASTSAAPPARASVVL